MTPDKEQKVIETLSRYGELSMIELQKTTEIRRNDLFELIPYLETENKVKTRIEGREKLISLSSPDKDVKAFIITFDKQLDQYEKSIKTELKALEKNKPLVSTSDHPFVKVKTKVGVLELDKERNVYRDMGKTEDSYAYTFKTVPKARKHFDELLNLINTLYQESSALNYADDLVNDTSLLKAYQKRAQRLIKNTTSELERMFHGEKDFIFVAWHLRNVLHGLIYKETLKL